MSDINVPLPSSHTISQDLARASGILEGMQSQNALSPKSATLGFRPLMFGAGGPM